VRPAQGLENGTRLKIDATAQQIRALLQLAELDAQEPELPPDAYRSRREASRRRVEPALLERYEALLEAARFPAIVAAVRQTCSGCHIRLPTMVESQMRRSPAVHACPHCGRMVYAAEHLLEAGPEQVSPKKAERRRAARPGEPGSQRTLAKQEDT
jgi:predicted  nucleic acid-binding Zn-ribbon protein